MYENLAAFAHCNNTTGFLNNVIQHYTKTYNFVTLDAFLPVHAVKCLLCHCCNLNCFLCGCILFASASSSSIRLCIIFLSVIFSSLSYLSTHFGDQCRLSPLESHSIQAWHSSQLLSHGNSPLLRAIGSSQVRLITLIGSPIDFLQF